MCLAIPAKVFKIENNKALIKYSGRSAAINVSLIPNLKAGDWILYSGGMAVKKISPANAKKILQLLSKSNYSSKKYEHNNK